MSRLSNAAVLLLILGIAGCDQQSVVRMNRDTRYSAAIFDLDAGPVTITLPDAGKRFLSMQVINQDEYTPMVVYGKGTYSLTKENVGTRYVAALVRILADPTKDVPVDGFWSVSVYNAKGYFEQNPYNAYSVNNLTAQKNSDGSVTVQFGGCDRKIPNCVPITNGWNATVRLYRPHPEVLSGKWKLPALQPS
jgi:hypothetical protein